MHYLSQPDLEFAQSEERNNDDSKDRSGKLLSRYGSEKKKEKSRKKKEQMKTSLHVLKFQSGRGMVPLVLPVSSLAKNDHLLVTPSPPRDLKAETIR
jgi:hypothetical protein